MKTATCPFAILTLAFLAISCAGSDGSGNDPVDAERIYEPDTTAALTKYVDKGGYKMVYNEEPFNCRPHFFALYTPSDNLKLILAACSECGDLAGYKIIYDIDGKVCDVIVIDDIEFDQDPYPEKDGIRVLKNWMNTPEFEGEHFTIVRDEAKNITSVGSIDVPSGYTASYCIKEWGEFWTSDIRGGKLAFFVQLVEKDKEGRSTVDYLYCDGHLVAELAYWNGAMIKALYYDQKGHFQGIKEECDSNSIFWDLWKTIYFSDPVRWYVDPEMKP